MNCSLKQVLLILVDAFGLKVTLRELLILEVLLLRLLALVKRVCQPLLLLKHSLTVKLDRLVDLKLNLGLSSLKRCHAVCWIFEFFDLHG